MLRLSPIYAEIKQLRSKGHCAAAIAKLRAHPPTGEIDTFQAVVSLFVCGDYDNALRIGRSHRWKARWAADIVGALTAILGGGDRNHALAQARNAVRDATAPYDAAAIYLLLLQQHGLIEEALDYIHRRLRDIPADETFLLTITSEIALNAGNLLGAYRDACTVHAADPNDYRALIVLSIVAFNIGNIHGSLGYARSAQMLHKGSMPAVLQLMRCHNRLGGYYAALAAFETLLPNQIDAPDIRVELGKAYEGLGDRERALSEYRNALQLDPQSVAAVRSLLGIYALGGYETDLETLKAAYHDMLHGDSVTVSMLGIDALNRGDIQDAARLFKRAAALNEGREESHWPIPESRVRHDLEQLELLEKRGKLCAAGAEAIPILRRYCAQPDALANLAPNTEEGRKLMTALATTFHVDEIAFPGPALGTNDFTAIEAQYFAEGIVVIDDFLSASALDTLRRYCEESTVWKASYQRGYVGAMLREGFCPEVLLRIVYELKGAMPRVIGDSTLLQAWAYKYDQRLQGINMHADFAKVNVNFWIAPDDACIDSTSGGMVVYKGRVPDHWTFYEYNNDAEKLAVYVKVNKAASLKVPHRANRCVLFDSKLIHRTDDMHFKPGYENRRVNVTLLYGNGFAIS